MSPSLTAPFEPWPLRLLRPCPAAWVERTAQLTFEREFGDVIRAADLPASQTHPLPHPQSPEPNRSTTKAAAIACDPQALVDA